jgi:hypothetical protein
LPEGRAQLGREELEAANRQALDNNDCEPEGMCAAHEVHGPRFARAILTTEELLALLPERGFKIRDTD